MLGLPCDISLAIEVMTGNAGQYSAGSADYLPPEPFARWKELVGDEQVVLPR